MSGLISTAAQCRALDAALIDRGLPGIALMEVASRGVGEVVREELASSAARGVAVLCGPGNNGGDGYGAARWLKRFGFSVWTVPASQSSSGDAAVMRSVAAAEGIEEREQIGEAGLIVDALFGTGLGRAITGRAAELLAEAQRSGAEVVAVDLPSGLDADTGQTTGPCLPARHTVTFGRLKPAFFTPGATVCGVVHLVDIGVDRTGDAIAELTTGAAVRQCWVHRASHAYKQSSGHLAVVAGSETMAGAAVLTCWGAVRAGAGLVTLFTAPDALSRLSGLPPTVMVEPCSPVDAMARASTFDAWVVGPGLGGGSPLDPDVVRALDAALRRPAPVVVDADALRAGLPYGPHTVLTPHPGEAGRLLGLSSRDVQRDRFRRVTELPGVALLKGRHTLIHAAGRVSVNPTGAPTLATAGSGDVLTGVIGGLMARGMSPVHAATSGAFLHGAAGELLAGRRSEGWSALDIAHAVPDAIEEVVHVPC